MIVGRLAAICMTEWLRFVSTASLNAVLSFTPVQLDLEMVFKLSLHKLCHVKNLGFRHHLDGHLSLLNCLEQSYEFSIPL